MLGLKQYAQYINADERFSGSAKNSRGVSPPRIATLLVTRPPIYPLTNITTHPSYVHVFRWGRLLFAHPSHTCRHTQTHIISIIIIII